MAGIVHHVGMMGYVATQVAYRDGKSWKLALLDYLRDNRDRVEQAIHAIAPLRITHAEATYLSWIDARALAPLNVVEVLERSGVGVYEGTPFGAPGFFRLNFACPRAVLDEALGRVTNALKRI